MQFFQNSILIKTLIVIISILVIGLPINHLFDFIILLFILPIIFFSKLNLNKKYFNYLIVTIFFLILLKFFIPSIKIQEGHNIVIINENSKLFYKAILPNNVFKFFNDNFKYYRNNSTCENVNNYCWKYFDPNRSEISNVSKTKFAQSSDWSIENVKYSRIVNDISFSNLKEARLGTINNLNYNFAFPNKFDLVRENLPFFIMYEIPTQLVGSSFCWKGNIFWQQDSLKFEKIFHQYEKCKIIQNSDIGKNIYVGSLGSNESIDRLNELYDEQYVSLNDQNLQNFLYNNELILNLKKRNFYIIADIIKKVTKTIIIFLIFILLLKHNYYLYLMSGSYLLIFYLLINYVNSDLIHGFTIFTGGNDGLVYMSYANRMFSAFLDLDIYEFFRGGENIFYFMPGLRYFFAITKIFFGDTNFGYLLIGFFYPIVIFLLFKSFLDFKFSIFFTFFIFLTRVFEGYALSTYNFLQHIHNGDSEPLGIFFLLLGLLIFIKFVNSENKIKFNSNYLFYFGICLFISTSIRPNYFPTTLSIFSIMLFYLYFKNYNIKFILWCFAGYSFLILLPFHNYFYGQSLVLFTTVLNEGHNTLAPIKIWINAFTDILTLNLDNYFINHSKVLNQLDRWVKPQEVHYIFSFIIIFVVLFSKSDFFVKTICIMALSQHAVCLVFMPDNRYAYLAWILTFFVNVYFFKKIIINSNFFNNKIYEN